MRGRIACAFILACMLLLTFSTVSLSYEDQNLDGMIVRLCPPPGKEDVMKPDSTIVTTYTGEPFSDLMDNPNDWSTTRSSIDYLNYFSWILNDKFSDSLIHSFVSSINK